MPTLVRPRYSDPLEPKLYSADSLPVSLSTEQKFYIKQILDLCCSDSLFAKKAYEAISRVLTSGPIVVIPVVVTSLNPGSVILGSPSFDIHVIGTGFTPDSVIMFNGLPEPTTFISETELTTGVDMTVWVAAAVVPVGVDGSNTVDFSFGVAGTQSVQSVKK